MTVPSKADLDKRKGGTKPSVHVGDVYSHETWGDYVVIDYTDAKKVAIYFSNSGYISSVSAKEIKDNCVRDHSSVRVYGVGINDADYKVVRKVHKGKGSLNEWKCPFWTKWISMLDRCYSGNSLSYNDTKVCDEWLTFSNFKAWMETQDWEGKHLDKDLLGNGKLYSPDTCCFIDAKLNGFLVDCNKPLCGVSKNGHLYQARCANPFASDREKGRYLGLYETPKQAHLAWKKRKHELACQLAMEVDNLIVRKALMEKFYEPLG